MAFVAAALACTYATARIAQLPAADLATYVADDTFYYLVLARNLAGEGALTFDGVNSASGVHPAWLAVLSTLSALGLEGISFVRAAIYASLICHMITAWFVVRLVAESGARQHAVWAGALWMLNPISLLLVAEAMEAPLFVAVLAAAAVSVQRLLHRGPEAPVARSALLLGTLCLVRTDGLIVAAVGVALIAASRWWQGARWRSVLISSIRLAAPSAIAVASFMLFLKLQTGFFTQASGELKMFWGGIATAGEKLALWSHVMGRLTFGAFPRDLFGLPTKLSAAAAIAALVFVAISRWRARRASEPAALMVPAWLLGAATIASSAYALVLFEYRAWYMGLPAFAMFAAVTLEAARRVRAPRFALAAVLLMAVMAAQNVRIVRAQSGRYPYAKAIYESVGPFDALVPPDVPIASFDAGVRGFFARHRVINLDGLVNDATRPYWKQGRMDLYLEHEGIEFIADESGIFDFARQFTPLPPLEPIACVPVRDPTFRDRCLWRLRR